MEEIKITMRQLISQLFLNNYHIRREIEGLQSTQESMDNNRLLIDSKHQEWDRNQHMIDLFFESINM